MKKLILSLLAIFTIINCFSQTEASAFVPRWKVGDKKSFISTTTTVKTKKSMWDDDAPVINKIEIEVKSEDAKDFHLSMYKIDPIYNAVKGLENNIINKEFKDSVSEIKFLLNKTTGEIKLVNWEEMKTKIDEMIGKLEALNDSEDEDKKQAGSMVKLVLMPIKFSFNDENSAIETFTKDVKYVFTPFQHAFKMNEKITVIDKGENPFKPGDSVGMTTIYSLSDMTETSCKINGETTLDMTEFKKMMKEMMAGMINGLSDDKKSAKKTVKKTSNEIDDIDMSMTMVETIDFNPTTTWPNSYTHVAKIIMKDSKRKDESTVTTNVEVK